MKTADAGQTSFQTTWKVPQRACGVCWCGGGVTCCSSTSVLDDVQQVQVCLCAR